MLNRRSLRVKVMQSLFAFHQSIDAAYLLCLDRITETFTVDLNSMEVQDKTELKVLKEEAIKVFEEAFAEEKKTVKHENKRIEKAVNDSLSFYREEVKKDQLHLRKGLILEVEKIADYYYSTLSLLGFLAEAAAEDKRIDHSNFTKNSWVIAIRESKELEKQSLKKGIPWRNNLDRVRTWMKDVVRQDAEYLAYLDKRSPSIEDQKKIVNHIFRRIILGKTIISDFFEEEVLRWAEDRDIVKGMVEKTVKSYDPEAKTPLELHELSLNWEDDRQFIERLFNESVSLDNSMKELISANTRNWEVDRLPLTDLVILEMAIAEMITFPNIPVKVTMNEYIELAKNYSTPKSRQFVNGILDVISKELKKKGILTKSGRGLIDNK